MFISHFLDPGAWVRHGITPSLSPHSEGESLAPTLFLVLTSRATLSSKEMMPVPEPCTWKLLESRKRGTTSAPPRGPFGVAGNIPLSHKTLGQDLGIT